MKATIDRDGRIELTCDMQIRLGVQPGGQVIVESCGNDLVLKSAKSETGLGLEGNVLVHRGTLTGPLDTELAAVREERFEQLTEGFRR